ncbi:CXXC motif containing zinc binding protein [Galendromus occidentalis]|uniref:CXXC motif containing zinc binding protein n=1 Tax=Galendromus occidentalis TaxID=34638 RepID=A0AAJ6QNM2_9ACAR|nr:CXXC motif containing zinc binding protein [Galendromus occidentalis]
MVKIALELNANLENLVHLEPADDSFVWYLKVKCGGCGEVNDNWVSVELESRQDIPGSRGDANLVIKCKLCSRTNTLDIITDSRKAYTTSEKSQKIIAFDCRGLELVDFDPRDGWVAKTEEGKVFDEVDLTEKEWTDYDEKKQQTVGVYEVKWSFKKL